MNLYDMRLVVDATFSRMAKKSNGNLKILKCVYMT